mmetsp:Transcript_31065/g.64983  ORF Transcript_31065/g.64983 Transcript_31065/m.64983 type:complete len:180 (-) Transcript_31065:5-544(-)
MAESSDTSYQNKIDDALAVLGHISDRVSIAATIGLGFGATYGVYKGLPIPKMSISAGMSCALISTACFTMERLAHGVINQASKVTTNDAAFSDDVDSQPHDNKILKLNGPNNTHVCVSHALGGFLGGGVVGFLFQGRPFAGALVFTPLMLGIGQIEVSLKNYRAQRTQELLERTYQKSD